LLQFATVAALPVVVLLPWSQATVTRWPDPIVPQDVVCVSWLFVMSVSVPVVHKAETYSSEPGLLQSETVAAVPVVVLFPWLQATVTR
jgi:hypothetical protein